MGFFFAAQYTDSLRSKKSTSHDALRIVLVDFFCKEIPYGYIRNPEKNTFDVDEETAPVVVPIFEQ